MIVKGFSQAFFSYDWIVFCAEDVANSLFACEIDDVSSYYSSGSAKSSRTSYTSKRRRGANSSILTSTPRHKPLKSTAELLSTIGLTNAHIDSCNVRCGVGKLMPLRPVVERLLRRTVVKFSDILPLELQRLCFEQAIETIDRMLMGFHEGVPLDRFLARPDPILQNDFLFYSACVYAVTLGKKPTVACARPNWLTFAPCLSPCERAPDQTLASSVQL